MTAKDAITCAYLVMGTLSKVVLIWLTTGWREHNWINGTEFAYSFTSGIQGVMQNYLCGKKY